MKLIQTILTSVLAMISLQAQAVTYSFDADAQGFSTTDGLATYVSSGGNPGGFLDNLDTTNGDMTLHFGSNALGNWSSYQGGTFSFDAKNLNGDVPDYGNFGIVTLSNSVAGTSVSFDLAPNGHPFVGGGWTTFSAVLNNATWGNNLTSVLNNVTSASIILESHDGVSEHVGVDNVTIAAAVPEPETWAMMAAGLALLGMTKRRSKTMTKS